MTHSSTSDNLTRTSLLKGRTILDCSALLPGPHVGKLLADHGAHVIKIESPERPDPARSMPSFYADLNEKKELRQISLLSVKGRQEFEELLKTADGLIEGFRPAAKKKLGLDWPTLSQIHPSICVASIIGYDEKGPRANEPGHDLNFQAATGTLSLTRGMPGLPWADLIGAHECALSMVCLLDRAARTGEGGRVSISLPRALFEAQSVLYRLFQDTGTVPEPNQTLFSGMYPCYRLYKAQDGRSLAVGALEEKFWKIFCEKIGLPELIALGRATGPSGEEVAKKVQAKLSTRPGLEWQRIFEETPCCVNLVLNYSEVDPNGL